MMAILLPGGGRRRGNGTRFSPTDARHLRGRRRRREHAAASMGYSNALQPLSSKAFKPPCSLRGPLDCQMCARITYALRPSYGDRRHEDGDVRFFVRTARMGVELCRWRRRSAARDGSRITSNVRVDLVGGACRLLPTAHRAWGTRSTKAWRRQSPRSARPKDLNDSLSTSRSIVKPDRLTIAHRDLGGEPGSSGYKTAELRVSSREDSLRLRPRCDGTRSSRGGAPRADGQARRLGEVCANATEHAATRSRTTSVSRPSFGRPSSQVSTAVQGQGCLFSVVIRWWAASQAVCYPPRVDFKQDSGVGTTVREQAPEMTISFLQRSQDA